MHIPTFVFIFILFLKNILLLLLYPKHVIKLLRYNLGCYSFATRGRRQGSNVAPSTGRGSVGQGEIPECPHFHRRHLEICRLLTGRCFRCGSTEHFMENCPKESRDNRNPQSNSRGGSAAPPSTRDRGRGRGGQSQHRG